AASQIGYEHLAALGGLRHKSRDVAASVNAFWQNDSFHNYADYAMTAAFRDGLARLRELGGRQRSAIMGAEAGWWRCHPRIIPGYRLAGGDAVSHIRGPPHVDPARRTEAARREPEGRLPYPATNA